jgi:hypothetical protein
MPRKLSQMVNLPGRDRKFPVLRQTRILGP